MQKDFKKLTLIYLVMAVIVTGLSAISLVFNEWVLIPCVAITSLFGYLVLYVFYVESKSTNTKQYFLFVLIRYAIMAIGLVLDCLLIKFTMGADIEKKRYLMSLIAAIPYIFPIIVLLSLKTGVVEDGRDR